MKVNNVKIRMYRQGLGDCFLLCFCQGTKIISKIMIDCGTFANGDSPEKLKRIAQNIIDEFGGKLDALVVTHEHQDHVYGFLVAQDLWNEIKIGKYWLAWTEDPDCTDAKTIKSEIEKKRTALSAAFTLLEKAQLKTPPNTPAQEGSVLSAAQRLRLKGVKSVVAGELSFQGLELEAAGKKNVTKEAMDYIRKRAKSEEENTEYLEPGQTTVVPKATDIKVLVLGPPRNAKQLKRMYSAAKGVMYMDDMNPFSACGLVAALTTNEAGVEQAASAFDKKFFFKPPITQVPAHPVPQPPVPAHPVPDPIVPDPPASATSDDIHSRYNDESAKWRNIDIDWLMNADSLAMHIGNYTNNTSLALAFYLPSGEILLFPGDAQLGNWESWQQLKFKLKDPETGKTKEISMEECMSKTIFYKASHHASHNGTLRDLGLELMNRDKLVVMVPVDDNDPKTKQYKFPYSKLNKRLQQLSGNRYMRLDDTEATFLKQKPNNMSPKEYKDFKNSVRFDEDGLYLEYTLRF